MAIGILVVSPNFRSSINLASGGTRYPKITPEAMARKIQSVR